MLAPMEQPDWKALLELTARLGVEYLQGLPQAPVRAELDGRAMLEQLDAPLPAEGEEASALLRRLDSTLRPGVTAMQSGRFFGWVIGGSLPAALAADWMTSVYDQNTGMVEPTPAAAIVEQVALGWVRELLGLPAGGGSAVVTGAQMATTTCLLAGRHRVLASAGWDVEARGLQGAPPVAVIVGAECHTVIRRALRVLGLGTDCVREVACDGQGAMLPDAFVRTLEACDGPTLVCAQAGHVSTGAFDPLDRLADAIAARSSDRGQVWLHVDGAFGLWARACERLRHLARGAERADSWATDGHKWLNTPYDCGIALTADEEAHRRALSVRAAYLPLGDSADLREPMDYTPEFSRRARGIPLYAALACLGRDGVEALVDRCCRHAERFASALAAEVGVEVVNDVVLNQVLVGFRDPAGEDDDRHTDAVIAGVQQEGVCFMSGTTFGGRRRMRISVSNWSTDEADVDASVASILRHHRSQSHS